MPNILRLTSGVVYPRSASGFAIDASGYLNWATTLGTNGYGIRDNAGTIELKNSGGAWAAIDFAGGTTLFGDGTVSLPGIAFSADTDTGLYRIGANNVGAAAGGSLIWSWLSTGLVSNVIASLTTPAESWIGPTSTTGVYFKSGNVGIGTVTPGGKIEVNTGANSNVLITNDSVDTGYNTISLNGTRTKGSYSGLAGGGTGDANLYLNSGNDTVFQTGSGGTYNTRLTILNAGNVGIGTGTPAALLDVTKSALVTTSTDGIAIVNTTAATAGVPVQISPRLRFRSNVWNTTATAATNTDDWWFESIPTSSAAPGGSFYLKRSVNGGASTAPLVIDQDGVLTALNAIISVNSGLVVNASSFMLWNGRTQLLSPVNGQLNVTNNAVSAGVGLDFVTDSILKIRTRAQTGYATLDALGMNLGGAVAVSSTAPTAAGTGMTITAATGSTAFSWSFTVTTANAQSAFTITLPTASNAWNVQAQSLTNPGTMKISVSSRTTTTAVLTQYSQTLGTAANYVDGDVITGTCIAY